MLWIYRVLVFMLKPFALKRLGRLAKSCSNKTQAAEPSRLGKFPWRDPNSPPPNLWLHGASVGEVATLTPLIERWLDKNQRLLVTTFTPTGLDQLQERFGDSIETAFLPLDAKGAIQRWLKTIQPPALIVAETELWPELYHQCHLANIPIVLVSARLSERRLIRYRRWHWLYQHAIDAITLAACQSEAEAMRWHELGLAREDIAVTGNLKASGLKTVSPWSDSSQMKGSALDGDSEPRSFKDFVWTAGSVHPTEDEVVLNAHQRLLKDYPGACLIIAPRHLRNVPAIKDRLDQMKLTWARFDPLIVRTLDHHPAVYLIEEMGQLMAAYALADVCFVGGTCVDVGGHNLYEPAALKKPVITGPHIEQQQAAADQLKAAGGLIMVRDAQTLFDAIQTLAKDAELAGHMGQAAHSVVQQESLSLEKTIEAIEPRLPIQ